MSFQAYWSIRIIPQSIVCAVRTSVRRSSSFNLSVLLFSHWNSFYESFPAHPISISSNRFSIGLISSPLVSQLSLFSRVLSSFSNILVPYFISLSINLLGLYSEISLRTYFAMSLLRIFRFLRIVKLYRIFQHIKALRVLASTLKESIPDFIILFSILTLSGFLVGAAIYFVENDLNPQVFDSIPKATYYGIITLTAVG